MKQEFQDKKKEKVIVHLMHSTKYSMQGLRTTFKEEMSVKLLLLAYIIILLLSLAFHITPLEHIFMFLAFGLMFVVELLNTAIENIVDLVTKEYHELAKKAKDQGSAATFISIVMALITFIYIFYPYFMGLK